MKTNLIRLTCILGLLIALASGARAQGTVFTYQGRFTSGSAPANGSYDFAFTLYAVNVGGSGVAGPVTNAAVAVTNGLFTTTVDLGNAFTGADRWLELAVRTNGNGAFTTLVPRQQLTPTPYAVYSANAGSAATAATAISAGSAGSVSAANITGALTPSQLPAGVITNGASGVNISGTFSGNGANVTNINLTANSGGAISWLGDFVLGPFLFLGVAPYSVVVADVNGDGKPDLINASYNVNTLTVWTNNGSGGFIGSTSLAVGSGPISVTAADVNGDGKPDLISAN